MSELVNYNSLKEWKDANPKEYSTAYRKKWLEDICELNGWYYRNTNRITAPTSKHEYKELMHLVKGKTKLINFIKSLFDKKFYIKTYNTDWNWELTNEELALENLNNNTNRYHDDDGWELIQLEENYKEYLEENGPENIRLNNGRYIVIVREGYFIALHILKVKNKQSGKINSWLNQYDDTTDVDLNLHTENCNCHSELERRIYDYHFSYKFKNYTAKVNPCINNYNGIPHKDILEEAITRINQKLNIKHNDRYYTTNINDESTINYEVERENRGDVKDKNIITEIITTGGFNKAYYIKHNVSKLKLNINTIISQDLDKKMPAYYNIYHLLNVINRIDLMNDDMKEMLRKEKEFNKQYNL